MAPRPQMIAFGLDLGNSRDVRITVVAARPGEVDSPAVCSRTGTIVVTPAVSR